jgi:hypothetical protein
MTWDDIFGIMESHPVHTEHVDNLAITLICHNTTAGINGRLYLHSRYRLYCPDITRCRSPRTPSRGTDSKRAKVVQFANLVTRITGNTLPRN